MADETKKNGEEKPEQPDLTAAERREHAQLLLEHQRLQTEDLRTRVEMERLRRAERERLHVAHQQAIEAERIQRDNEQGLCSHKKGGTDHEQFFAGDDNKYSVIKNIYPWGLRFAMCTRCLKEVSEPSHKLKAENPKEHAKQLAEFRTWWAFPTNNVVSGSVIFAIVPNAARAKRPSQAHA